LVLLRRKARDDFTASQGGKAKADLVGQALKDLIETIQIRQMRS
jgi:hypothetical protein